MIGGGADCAAGITNATAIGAGASVNASNKVRIGNGSVSVIEGQVAFSNPSRQLKKDIQDIELGLNFVRQLRPVQYIMKEGNGKTDYGFIAQEVIEVLDSREVNLYHKGEKYYGVRYNDFIAPLTKAVQEIDQENQDLKIEIEALKTQVQKLETQNADLKVQVSKIDKLESDIQKLMQFIQNQQGNSQEIETEKE